jgi:aromatic-L-amino-acid decarboxylase
MPVPHMTPDEFRALGRRIVDWVADYHQRVGGLPVLSGVAPGQVAAMLPANPPEQGLADDAGVEHAWAPVFDDLERIILPGLTHWQSPGFFAYFPCNASFPAILGELLSAGLNVNGMLWATSPAATELETRVLDWLGLMIDLPESFRSTAGGGGCIQGTASESVLVAMVAARRRARTRQNDPGADLVCYASREAHSSVVKAAMVAGIAVSPDDHAHVRLVGTDENHAIRPELLADAIREDRASGRTPFFVCATVGTTSSTAVDPLEAVASVVADASTPHPGSIWLHVDAAHSGCACVCPEFRWMIRGIEHADSFCFNPHKWLLTNFDCNSFFVRDRAALTDALSVMPEYLRNQATERGAVIDYRDWQIPLGRRFRALKLWLVIRHYGVEGLRRHIREHIRLAELFEGWVRRDSRFEVAAPRTVNLVCFRICGDGPAADDANRGLLARVNNSGRAFLSHTVLHGRFVLRMAIGATWTDEARVRETWEIIRAAAYVR